MNPSPKKGLPLRWRDNGPCYGCEKRSPACHDKCPDYQEFNRLKEERKALERKNRENYNAVNEFKAAQISKATHRKLRER
jgi:predicted ATP-dependent serine protease